MSDAPLTSCYRPRASVDASLTLAPLRHGLSDPTIRFEPGVIWRATRTPSGPATLRLRETRDGFDVLAWGPGAERAIAGVPDLLGEHDDPSALVLPPGRLRELQRQRVGLRLPRTRAVFESLLPAIIEQKVTGFEAWRSYRGLIRRFGEAAPGPGRLQLAPAPALLASLPYHLFHPLDLEQRRADVIRHAAARSAWLEEGASLAPDQAAARLRSIRGIGPWTAAEAARTAFGDPDAVSVGDYHLPRLVCSVLAGEPDGDDARMLELLEPYRGQRARLVRLIETAGRLWERHAPRMSPRSIAGM